MIRVLIERTISESMEREFHEAQRSARQSAMTFPGYISGETLRDVANPCHHVVISTWRSAQDWEKWAHSEERQHLLAAISPCLDEPESDKVLEPM